MLNGFSSEEMSPCAAAEEAGPVAVSNALGFQDAGKPKLLARVGRGGVETRQSLGSGGLHLDARLDDAQIRGLEIEVSPARRIDQVVELGIVKLAPPE